MHSVVFLCNLSSNECIEKTLFHMNEMEWKDTKGNQSEFNINIVQVNINKNVATFISISMMYVLYVISVSKYHIIVCFHVAFQETEADTHNDESLHSLTILLSLPLNFIDSWLVSSGLDMIINTIALNTLYQNGEQNKWIVCCCYCCCCYFWMKHKEM